MSNTVKIKRGGKMAKSKDQSCGNCGAFVPEDENGGTCHRKAPHCQMEGMMQDGEAYATVGRGLLLTIIVMNGYRRGNEPLQIQT
jgi:hypothetical protein